MQRGFSTQFSVKSRKHLPAFSDYTSKQAYSAEHDRCRKNAYFLPKCAFYQKYVLFSRSLAILFPCLSDTGGSISDSHRSRKDGIEGRHPHAFEKTSIPLFFPSPSDYRESPVSKQRHCIELQVPDTKRYFSDPATRYDTRDPTTHPLPRKQSPVWQACPGYFGADKESHIPPLHTHSRPSRPRQSIRSPSQ